MVLEINNNMKLGIAFILIVIVIALLGVKTPQGSSLVSSESICANPLACAAKNAAPVDKEGFVIAPELSGINGYINADSNISIYNLRGKIVIVDFWTYSCINCIRTIPYLNAWHEKYADNGLVVIGVHSPEFEFEKDYSNLEKAVRERGIKYPVVQDNDFATWRAYNNRYWPHKFLVDTDGYIRYDHIGEGDYEQTEQKIIELLKERDSFLKIDNTSINQIEETEFIRIGTPELYLGYDFARAPLGNTEGFVPDMVVDYNFPGQFTPNIVYLEGEWENNSDSMKLVSQKGKVVLIFTAKNVNIVAGSSEGSILSASIDGKNIDRANMGGGFVEDGGGAILAPITTKTLYNVVSLPDYEELKKLEISIEGSGFELYTFTFG